MELAERMRKIMKEQFGIETDEQLIEAVSHLDSPDLGIFVSPMKGAENNAS